MQHAAEKPFMEYWASTIYPMIKDDYERLLNTTPTRIAERHQKKDAKKEKKAEKEGKAEDEEKDANKEKITGVVEEVKKKGERRNVYMNLAWTGPVDNSFLQEKVSLGKVQNSAAGILRN